MFKVQSILGLAVSAWASLSASQGLAATPACDGLTAVAYIDQSHHEDLSVACAQAQKFAAQLMGLNSISVRAQVGGCGAQSTDVGVFVRARLDPVFARQMKLDSFDLAKRIWQMKSLYKDISSVVVCRD